MSDNKERLFGAIMIMSEEKALKMWEYAQKLHGLGFEEVEAMPDEIAALEAYERGDEDYQPYMSHEDVMKEFLS